MIFLFGLYQVITSQCPVDPMVMGNRRMEKSEELRLLYYLRIYGDSCMLCNWKYFGTYFGYLPNFEYLPNFGYDAYLRLGMILT